jgi:peptidyl-prolyl cis-trans isomerase D
MPFAVFRRHQKKLLAIFAILAMFGFVLADSLPRLLSGGYAGGNANPVVVTLYRKSVRMSDLNAMAAERNRANRFLAELSALLYGVSGPPVFGDVTSTRALVDALILQHEADALGMPAGPEVARDWLKQVTNDRMNGDLFEALLRGLGNQVSGDQILRDIASQLRLNRVRQLPGAAVVTPLDVFRAYRDQNERVAVKAASFPVANYVASVAEPTRDEVQQYYAKYEDVLPDPTRETPGFKIPRQIKVEVLAIDGAALARSIEAKLTEAELRAYYENRKSEFIQPTGFPDDIFANDPKAELTPPQPRPFEEMRPYLATSLAEERAGAEIDNRFVRIKDDVLIPFADSYHDALEEITEAKKTGEQTTAVLPTRKDLKALAATEGLTYEITPLLTREQAESYGQIASAEVGLRPFSGGRKFAAEMFDPKTSLYEPVEFADALQRRFLARKIQDDAPRVPPLDEIRPEVVLAWKTEKARPKAEKAAQEFAAAVRKDGGTIKTDHVADRPVIVTEPVTRMQPSLPLSPERFYSSARPIPTELSQFPYASEELRDAYFGLMPGAVAVAANQPKTVYYVLALDRRMTASFAALYAPNGDYIRYQREALTTGSQERDRQWMSVLRERAGLDPKWVPSDEAKSDEARGESSSRS